MYEVVLAEVTDDTLDSINRHPRSSARLRTSRLRNVTKTDPFVDTGKYSDMDLLREGVAA